MRKYALPILALALAGLGSAALTVPAGQSPKTIVRTDKAPKAIGPYSQGVVAGGFVFCSGQLGLDPATGKLVPGGIEDETRQALKNLQAVLEASGSSLDRVVKCTVILADMGDFAAMNKIYAGFFASAPPARAAFQAAKLALDAKVEIECLALPR
jgi:2-iminobutanoate/2-iminopropanoate deaminase